MVETRGGDSQRAICFGTAYPQLGQYRSAPKAEPKKRFSKRWSSRVLWICKGSHLSILEVVLILLCEISLAAWVQQAGLFGSNATPSSLRLGTLVILNAGFARIWQIEEILIL